MYLWTGQSFSSLSKMSLKWLHCMRAIYELHVHFVKMYLSGSLCNRLHSHTPDIPRKLSRRRGLWVPITSTGLTLQTEVSHIMSHFLFSFLFSSQLCFCSVSLRLWHLDIPCQTETADIFNLTDQKPHTRTSCYWKPLHVSLSFWFYLSEIWDPLVWNCVKWKNSDTAIKSRS